MDSDLKVTVAEADNIQVEELEVGNAMTAATITGVTANLNGGFGGPAGPLGDYTFSTPATTALVEDVWTLLDATQSVTFTTNLERNMSRAGEVFTIQAPGVWSFAFDMQVQVTTGSAAFYQTIDVGVGINGATPTSVLNTALPNLSLFGFLTYAPNLMAWSMRNANFGDEYRFYIRSRAQDATPPAIAIKTGQVSFVYSGPPNPNT